MIQVSVQRCALCKGTDALLEITSCGHTFHPRCVYSWPIETCQVCHVPANQIKMCRTLESVESQAMTRRIWHECEKDYCDALLVLFQDGTLPLDRGMNLRPMLATLLHCNPMRITKKYKQANQLGKQTYLYNPVNARNYTYKRHATTQKHVTMLRDAFYWQVQARGSGRHVVDKMRDSEAQFWLNQLVKFCKFIGQSLEEPTANNIEKHYDTATTEKHQKIKESEALNQEMTPSTPKNAIIDSPVHVEHTAESTCQLNWDEVVKSEIEYGPFGDTKPEECSLGFIIDENGLVQFESMYVDETVWSQELPSSL
ncbi:hypothetical protein THRCLA_05378 [Thraustotheca clavata]|uniref:RING-type domain-containing protein n=1 Tax=Thraustotheca clavata TaxID=74557 RepID=A0A1V9ZWR2_9STRA|nr:hypothetical protein THRCLA_05378 [Thraustotheca clavata]